MLPVFSRNRRRPSGSLVTIRPKQVKDHGVTVKVSAGLAGHSFVKNIMRHVDWYIWKEGRQPEVDSGKVWWAELAADAIKVQRLYYSVMMKWAYLYYSDDWSRAVNLVLAARPYTLVLNMARMIFAR